MSLRALWVGQMRVDDVRDELPDGASQRASKARAQGREEGRQPGSNAPDAPAGAVLAMLLGSEGKASLVPVHQGQACIPAFRLTGHDIEQVGLDAAPERCEVFADVQDVHGDELPCRREDRILTVHAGAVMAVETTAFSVLPMERPA